MTKAKLDSVFVAYQDNGSPAMYDLNFDPDITGYNVTIPWNDVTNGTEFQLLPDYTETENIFEELSNSTKHYTWALNGQELSADHEYKLEDDSLVETYSTSSTVALILSINASTQGAYTGNWSMFGGFFKPAPMPDSYTITCTVSDEGTEPTTYTFDVAVNRV